MLLALLLVFSFLLVPAQAAYPPPPPSIITVHTTTIIVSGSPSPNFDFNIQEFDNLSLITQLSLQNSPELGNFRIQIFQLNSLPPTLPPPNGRILLVFDFNLDPLVEQNITQASFYVKVPKVELSEFAIKLETVTVQRYIPGSWYQPQNFYNSSDADYHYYGVVSSGLSLFAVTGIQARGLPIPTLVPLIATIVIASLILRRRGDHSKPTL